MNGFQKYALRKLRDTGLRVEVLGDRVSVEGCFIATYPAIEEIYYNSSHHGDGGLSVVSLLGGYEMDNLSTPMDYDDALAEVKLIFDGGDPWGSIMSVWFSIADEIYHNRPGLFVPDEWQFHPSPLGPSNDPDQYETWLVENTSDDALVKLGALVHRAAGIARARGLSY